jgi:hypothetical protein
MAERAPALRPAARGPESPHGASPHRYSGTPDPAETRPGLLPARPRAHPEGWTPDLRCSTARGRPGGAGHSVTPRRIDTRSSNRDHGRSLADATHPASLRGGKHERAAIVGADVLGLCSRDESRLPIRGWVCSTIRRSAARATHRSCRTRPGPGAPLPVGVSKARLGLTTRNVQSDNAAEAVRTQRIRPRPTGIDAPRKRGTKSPRRESDDTFQRFGAFRRSQRGDRCASVCLTDTFRSRSFTLPQRFDPTGASWLYFKPLPPIGFRDLQSFSRPDGRTTSRRPLLSCRSTTQAPPRLQSLAPSRTSDTRTDGFSTRPSRCSPGLWPLRGTTIRPLGRSPPFTRLPPDLGFTRR